MVIKEYSGVHWEVLVSLVKGSDSHCVITYWAYRLGHWGDKESLCISLQKHLEVCVPIHWYQMHYPRGNLMRKTNEIEVGWENLWEIKASLKFSGKFRCHLSLCETKLELKIIPSLIPPLIPIGYPLKFISKFYSVSSQTNVGGFRDWHLFMGHKEAKNNSWALEF